MASVSGSTKRSNATASPVERDNKRMRTSADDVEAGAVNEAVSDEQLPSEIESASSVPPTSDVNEVNQPICATLVCGRRPVWAMKRQGLCDAQPYFKAFEGGLYSKDNIVTGLYISKYSEPRDFLGRNVLITCVGGNRDVKAGTRSDKMPRNTSMVRNSIGLPVSIVIGNQHPKFKDLNFGPHVPQNAAFVELGTFRIIDVWKEIVQPEGINDPYPVWKIKLHTIRTDLKPWYWIDEQVLDDTTSQDKLISHTQTASQVAPIAKEDNKQLCEEQECSVCGKASLKVFANAPWVCLEDECSEFFKHNGNHLDQDSSDGEGLRYAESFLNKAERYHGIMKGLPKEIPQMFQPLSISTALNGSQYGTEKELRGGFTCPSCGCCNSQVYWDYNECGNCRCTQELTPRPYPMDKIEKETRVENRRLQKKVGSNYDGTTINMVNSHVTKFTKTADNGSKLFIYMIQGGGKLVGTLVLERPTESLKKSHCGADDLLDTIQNEGAKMMFRRNPSRCPGSSSELLTRHYQSNWGVQYDFGVRPIPSVPFTEAPDVVLKSLAQLTDAGKRALDHSQMIALKNKYALVDGSTLMKQYEPYNELLALAYRETDAIGWHDDGEKQVKGVISTASLGSPGTMELCMKKARDKPILKLHVRHGDVVTMCDTRLQAHTEHRVGVTGVRRYAVTSRTIDIDYYKDPKRAQKLGTSVQQLEASGSFPVRARDFSYGNTTLGI
ncbi:hypothetical protein VM1G_04852 [Cytospora mali]|uniref:Fe2OG dioxygenase domain-containing protein n=1 Tax=Cytospora mali TaxID=578113 RepID=A0A194VZY3_CYTMA|nr:hypothetical protein VM1G_04852 [Valsa mali]